MEREAGSEGPANELLPGGETQSGFQEAMGYRLIDWQAGTATLLMPLGRRHLNRAGVIHGGVLAGLIDTAGGFAGCYCTVPGNVRRAVTLSLTTSYVSQASSGEVRAVGRVRGGGRRVFFAVAEVFDRTGTLIAFGEGTYRYRSGSEREEGTPP